MSRVKMSGTRAEFPANVCVNGDDNLARAVPALAQPQVLSAAVSGAPERLSQDPHIADKGFTRPHDDTEERLEFPTVRLRMHVSASADRRSAMVILHERRTW